MDSVVIIVFFSFFVKEILSEILKKPGISNICGINISMAVKADFKS